MDGGFTFGKILAGLAVAAAMYVGGQTVNHGNRLAATEAKVDAFEAVSVGVDQILEQQVSKSDVSELKLGQEKLADTQIMIREDVAGLKADVTTLKRQATRVEAAVSPSQ